VWPGTRLTRGGGRHVVSFGGVFSDDIHWGGALISIPWQLYREYGDKATLASAYPAQQRYVRSLQARSSGYLISFGLGDWITPAKGRQTQLTVSMGYYAAMRRMVDNATILGKPSDAAAYAATASQIRAAINAKYYRDGLYGSEQATNAMAVALGIAPDAERAKASLVSVMQGWQGHFNTARSAWRTCTTRCTRSDATTSSGRPPCRARRPPSSGS